MGLREERRGEEEGERVNGDGMNLDFHDIYLIKREKTKVE